MVFSLFSFFYNRSRAWGPKFEFEILVLEVDINRALLRVLWWEEAGFVIDVLFIRLYDGRLHTNEL